MFSKKQILMGCLVLSITLLFIGYKTTRKDIRVPGESDLQTFQIGDKEFVVELATTSSQQQRGLSGRTSIGSDGLLFVFDKKDIHPFWMKEMLFNLDFIWISDGKVSEITQNVEKPPKPDTPVSELIIYSSVQPVEMMLEVNAGFAQQHHIQVGDPVKLK